MSGRQRRKTKGKTAETPLPDIEEQPFRGRSRSPLNITRQEEKEEISYLNDRLATYIDYVRSLEEAKEQLTQRIMVFTDSQETELKDLRKEYEDELNSLRKALDNANSAHVQATRAQIKAENQATELSKSYKDANAKATALESDLEKEILARNNLENRFQSLQEQYEFHTRIAQQEASQLRNSCVVDIQDSLRTSVRQDYDSKLAEELRAVREETAIELEEYRASLEADFEKKYTELQNIRKFDTTDSAKLRSELSLMKQQYDNCKLEVDELKSHCKRLEADLDAQKDYYESRFEKTVEVERNLRQEIEKNRSDFSDLLSLKVELDREIAAYRKLLEIEEGRVNLVPPPRESSFKYMGRRSTSGIGLASKRRRFDEGDIPSYSSTVSGKGNVIIDSVDTALFQYVCIRSATEEEINLSQWSLSYKVDGKIVDYSIGQNIVLKPREKITIWGGNANRSAEPPSHLVMKEKFVSGSNITVSLADKDGIEQAGMKLDMTSSTRRHRIGAGAEGNEKCNLM